MNGSQLTSLDVDAYNELKDNENEITPEKYPYVFGWYCLVGRFSDARKAQWPKV